MNLFDRMLDALSGSDLSRRVWSVVIFGFALTVAAAVGGFAFLNSVQTISVDATGRCVDSAAKSIELQFDRTNMEALGSMQDLSIELKLDKAVKIPIRIHSIDHETNTMEVIPSAETTANFVCPQNRFDVRLILKQRPFWSLLWGGGQR